MDQRSLTNPSSPDEEVGLLELFVILAKHKKMVFGLPLVGGILALAIAFLLPPTYTATARILPPQPKESSAAATLGAFFGAAGGGAAPLGQVLGLRNPGELYVGILRSNTIADRLIDRFNLKSVYDVKTVFHARKELANSTEISTGKDGLIVIAVDDTDPQRAADIANAFVEELDRLMQDLAITEAAQRRMFFERQLAVAQEKLIAAQAALRHAIETKGITEVDAQSRTLLSTTEQLRAQIAVKKIQLDAMSAFATQNNPEAVRLRQEIRSMSSELESLESGGGTLAPNRSPAGLENVRKLREVKFQEFAVELLTKQYEIARIDEAKDAVLIQAVDKAIPPDYKTRPRRALIVITATLVCGAIGMLIALTIELLARINHDPRLARHISALRQHLGLAKNET